MLYLVPIFYLIMLTSALSFSWLGLDIQVRKNGRVALETCYAKENGAPNVYGNVGIV